MKSKLLFPLFGLLGLGLFFSACSKDDNTVAVSSISLSAASIRINTTETDSLSVKVLPVDATDKAVTWSSSNSAVATVSSAGIVKGISKGTCTVTATSSSDKSKSATCTVSVTAIY